MVGPNAVCLIVLFIRPDDPLAVDLPQPGGGMICLQQFFHMMTSLLNPGRLITAIQTQIEPMPRLGGVMTGTSRHAHPHRRVGIPVWA